MSPVGGAPGEASAAGSPGSGADADLQIAATAIYHGLALVTGNARHFARVPGLHVYPALANAR